MRSGVGETRSMNAPGAYMRAHRVERTVTLFSHIPAGSGCRQKLISSADPYHAAGAPSALTTACVAGGSPSSCARSSSANRASRSSTASRRGSAAVTEAAMVVQ